MRLTPDQRDGYKTLAVVLVIAFVMVYFTYRVIPYLI